MVLFCKFASGIDGRDFPGYSGCWIDVKNNLRGAQMNKIIVAAFVSVFLLGSTAAIASGNTESSLAPIAAKDMLNYLSCKDKKPTDIVKSRTDVENGKIVRVKCADVVAIVEKARKESGDAWQGGY